MLIQPFSRWVHLTLFVLVHVEVRVGHVCNECVIRLLETQEVDDASCARKDSIQRPVILELSRDERALIPFFQWSRSKRVVTRFFPGNNEQVHGLVHKNSASRSSPFRLAFVASLASALSTRGSSNSPASS